MHAQSIEILYFHKKLHSLPQKEQRKKFLHGISKHDRDKIINLWRHIIVKGHHDEQAIHTTYVVKQLLIQFSATDRYLSDINVNQINAIAAYMEKTKLYEDCVNIVDILYLERGVHTFTLGERLFKTLIEHFQNLQNDEVREMVAQNLIQFMRENKQYIKIANSPYYFLQYLLHLINQQEDPDKALYWFEVIQSLYLHPQSQTHLFYENDFRILIDILVRHIQNYNSEKELIKLIETYLALSVTSYIIKNHQYYKLDQIIIVINDVPNPSQALKGYTLQLMALSEEEL